MSWFTLRRTVARVVLLDRDGSVLLLRASDPADRSKPAWWEIPGGGIDRGETSADAARRELAEETGIVSGVEIGPCVWTQHVEFDFGGYHFDQDELIHVAWSERRGGEGDRWAPRALEALEAVAFAGMRWWELPDLLASADPLLPVRLREFLPDLVAGDVPASPLSIDA